MTPEPGCADDPELSVILPALNEEESIGACLRKISRVFSENSLRGEIIVVDSSTDGTAKIARDLGAKVIHPDRFGYGNAYLAGFREARGRIIVIGDADDTYDFSDIPRLVEPIRHGADLVIGSRFRGTILPGAMTPLHRYIGNPLLTWMLNAIFHTGYTDTHSGFRAIRKEALDRISLKSGGMEFASEMLIRASESNLKIAEIPITYSVRKTPSKLHSFADGWRHIRFVLLMRPIPFLALPGILFAAIGCIMIGLFFLKGNVEASHFNAFILAALFLLGGLQITLMGTEVSVYSVIHGYQEKRGFAARIMNYRTLEKFLFLGGILVALGILSGIRIIAIWTGSGFGELSEFSGALLSLILVISGMEILFFSILVSMMLLNENNGHSQVAP